MRFWRRHWRQRCLFSEVEHISSCGAPAVEVGFLEEAEACLGERTGETLELFL